MQPCSNYHEVKISTGGFFVRLCFKVGFLCESSQIDPGLFEMLQFDPFNLLQKEALAMWRVFLYDMITNTKFSNCTLVFNTGSVRQQNMQSKNKNRFQTIYH